MNVLVVDDEPQLARVVARHLERWGHTVSVAHNGTAALARIHVTRKFDLIISDVRMPELGGIELVARLRDANDVTPVVLMAGHVADMPQDIKPASNVRVLPKPFRANGLRALVDAIPWAEEEG